MRRISRLPEAAVAAVAKKPSAVESPVSASASTETTLPAADASTTKVRVSVSDRPAGSVARTLIA
ncbi:hypothetical protein BK022_10425 [Methylorubrum extorquens]|uniref:Uncharacterized protein n=1 Tax=Methylorubrum extorquens TaxID=408 RepID=A0A1S1P690_METEX|nr:hypothetical protein BK022_10425 [Methylorubrum extorquens]